MELARILKPDGVKVLGSCSSKKRLFHEIGDLAEQVHGLHSGAIVEALMEREALGPTGVGHGIALPHARLPKLEAVTGLFVRLEKPMEFDSIDRQPVDLIFALLAPQSAGVEHLKALALVSRTMRDANTCTKLRSNADPATLYTILTEATTSQAA